MANGKWQNGIVDQAPDSRFQNHSSRSFWSRLFVTSLPYLSLGSLSLFFCRSIMPKGAPSGGGGGGKSEKVQKAQRSAKKGTQKGRTRHFTSPEELAAQAAQLGGDPRDRMREAKGEGDTSEDDTSSASGSGSESDDDGEKTKGVEALIEIENPNRVIAKSKKISELTLDDTSASAAPQLSRKEREEIEKEKQKRHFEQLRAEGKTDQARADLARLAIVRQEREAAAKKREADQKVKDAAKGAKQDATPSLKKDAPSAPVSAVPPAKK